MILLEVQRDQFLISTDPSKLDISLIQYWFSTESYWAQDRSLETVQRSIEHSCCFGLYDDQRQVGFARVVTDYATFAWLCDVFILEKYQGRGLGKWLIETIVAQPVLKNLALFVLATRDAHGLYQRYGGFEPLTTPERWMARFPTGFLSNKARVSIQPKSIPKGGNVSMEVSPPVRVKRTYIQTLVAPPGQVFPLLCPVREVEWVNGWDPRLVISESGYIEPDCIFVLPRGSRDSIWVVAEWRPEDFLVKFIVVTPEFTVAKVEIQLRPSHNDQTLAEVSYSYTALSQEGSEFIEGFTPEEYESWMKEWESELNHFLQTGTKRG